MTDQAYIHDGYTKTAYIAPENGNYPAVRFEYRAMLTQDRSVVANRIEKTSDARKVDQITAATITSCISSWDIKKHDGEEVSLDTAEVLRIQPALFRKIFYILMSYSPTDVDPDLDPVEQADEADAELEAALAGTTPEALDAKN